MSRLNLTETAARDRIKNFINERYRRLASSISLGPVRFTTVSQNTAAGTEQYSPTGLIKVQTITYTAGNKVLDEMTLDQIRNIDADGSEEGSPERFAVVKYPASSVTIHIHPKPDAIYTLKIDGIATGIDLSANGDIPAFPEDFHDVLEFGAMADELEKMEKYKMAEKYERAYESRLMDLRYFIAKTAYLDQSANDAWWLGPWYGMTSWF